MIINLLTVVEETLRANFQSLFLFPMYFQEIGQLSMRSHAIAFDRMRSHAMLPLQNTVRVYTINDFKAVGVGVGVIGVGVYHK
jgi:hypothetical protein